MVLFVLCVTQWLLGAGRFITFVMFGVLLLYLVYPVQLCDQLLGEEGACYFAFLWFVVYVMSAMV